MYVRDMCAENAYFLCCVYLDLMQKLAALFLGGQRTDNAEASPKKDPVIHPLNLEGIAQRIKKISQNDESKENNTRHIHTCPI